MTVERRTERLGLNPGTYQRAVSADAEGTLRTITVENCAVGAGGKIGSQDFYKEHFTVELTETLTITTANGWAKFIGTLDINQLLVTAQVPTAVFDQVWRAAEAMDGTSRQLRFTYAPSQTEGVFEITAVYFIEVSFQSDKKHPILTELQKQSNQLASMSKEIYSIAFMLLILLVFLFWRLMRN
jgi:hypothetical protein